MAQWVWLGRERGGKAREGEASAKKEQVSAWLGLWFQDKGVCGLRAENVMAKGSLKQILVARLVTLGLDCENTLGI